MAKPLNIDLVCEIPATPDLNMLAKMGVHIDHPPAEAFVSIIYEPFDPAMKFIKKLKALDEINYYAITCSGIFYIEIDGPQAYRVPKLASLDCDSPPYTKAAKPADESKIVSGAIWIRGARDAGEFSDKKIEIFLEEPYVSVTDAKYTVEINRILGSLKVLSFSERDSVISYEGDCRKASKALF